MVTAALATALPRASMTVPSRAPSAVLAFEAAGKTPIKKRARTGRKIFMTDFKAILALAAGGFPRVGQICSPSATCADGQTARVGIPSTGKSLGESVSPPICFSAMSGYIRLADSPYHPLEQETPWLDTSHNTRLPA